MARNAVSTEPATAQIGSKKDKTRQSSQTILADSDPLFSALQILSTVSKPAGNHRNYNRLKTIHRNLDSSREVNLDSKWDIVSSFSLNKLYIVGFTVPAFSGSINHTKIGRPLDHTPDPLYLFIKIQVQNQRLTNQPWRLNHSPLFRIGTSTKNCTRFSRSWSSKSVWLGMCVSG